MKRPHPPGNGPTAPPRVRRGYFESRFGQLHVYNAMPPGGGFDEATAVLCLHANGTSARAFHGLLELLGRDRSTYAPDIPGFGQSDPAPERPAIADYANGIADFIDSMRFRQIDLIGWQIGAAIAAELALNKPQQVRRVIMIGVPLFSDTEREAIRRSATESAATEDGSHLVNDWRRTLESRESGIGMDMLAQRFAEKLQQGRSAGLATNALAQYPARERLAAITQPVLMLRPKDDLWEATLRAREILPRARFLELPSHGGGLLQAAPQVVADAARDFLKG